MSEQAVEFKIRINYRSGHQHVGWFSKFETSMSNGKLHSINWLAVEGVNFILMGIDDIESITQLSHRKVK